MKIHKYVIILILTTALLFSQDFNGLKFCIDPGHGGHESDDRHMLATDFWESEGNLTKAFHVKYILENHGAEVILTRDGNNDPPPTEDYGTEDDPTLYQRSEIANNNNVDFFHSIHSNGWNGTNNSTLMLFRGYDDDPVWDEALEMSDIMAVELYTANRTTHYSVRGDWDFYDWGTSGLGVLRHLNMPGVLSEGSFHDYIPESWRLLYLDGTVWKPVLTGSAYGIEKDRYNRVTFQSVETRAMRLEIKLQEEYSAGIHEWRIK